MTGLAIGLALASAVLHAVWNFLVKRSGASGATFTWLFTLPSVLVLAPVAFYLMAAGHVALDARAGAFLAGSAVIHTIYFLVLQQGYRVGHLSVVYPIARGSGPVLAGIAAVVMLKEQPSVGAIIGVLCVAGGAAMLAFETAHADAAVNRARASSVRYGLLIGAFIGIYTVWDKYLVADLAMPPVFLEWALSLSILLLVTPAAVSNRARLAATWRAHKVTAVAGAMLGSASYILFLTALALAPVTRVAPLRETSILIGAALGSRFLAEGDVVRRLAAAGAIALGVALLAVS
ncbi:MAG: DMT family transporter [Gemmatimonadaceae bacterium]